MRADILPQKECASNRGDQCRSGHRSTQHSVLALATCHTVGVGQAREGDHPVEWYPGSGEEFVEENVDFLADQKRHRVDEMTHLVVVVHREIANDMTILIARLREAGEDCGKVVVVLREELVDDETVFKSLFCE